MQKMMALKFKEKGLNRIGGLMQFIVFHSFTFYLIYGKIEWTYGLKNQV